jgi:prephenate dehydratase
MSLRIAYFGPAGTFTEAALRQLYTEDQAEAVPFPTIMATLDAVREGVTDRGVVPLENSVEGAVTATLDELARGRALIIRTEIHLPVAFALLGREGTDLAGMKVVSGHPQAQAQCRQWLSANLPHAEWRPASSNAEAARQAAEGQIDGALAGEFAASVYGLAVLARNVHDRATAVTRFVEVSLPGKPPAPTGADRTSVVAFLADDHPGALMEILTQFGAARG